MVTDRQVKRLFQLMQQEKTLTMAAAKAGLDEKTARKYRKAKKLPSELKAPRQWRTHNDLFADRWQQVRQKLELNPGLEAKTLFQDLQRRYPGRFADGQLRTFQRRVKYWRATEDPAKEVFFEQVYQPGECSQSDFTSMNKLGVTIQGEPFNHLIYHFVLPYSNWETGTIRRWDIAHLLRELRGPQPGSAERALGAGRRATLSSDRSALDSTQQRDAPGSLHTALPGWRTIGWSRYVPRQPPRTRTAMLNSDTIASNEPSNSR